jgi:branched-chain amino acid transport system permease protein
VALPVAAGLLLFARNLFRTKVGKAFVAIRDQDISSEVMGVNVFRYKLLSFAVSSFYVGVAGSLLAYQARIISPENFPISVAIDQLGMIIIGGLGSLLGSVFGAVFITLLPELLRLVTGALSSTFPELTTLFASVKMGVFGLAIVLFLIFEPDGMAARWHSIKNYWKLYPFSY